MDTHSVVTMWQPAIQWTCDGRRSAWKDAGVQGRKGWSGGSCVLWPLGMRTWRNQMNSTRCSDPTCMYMYIHAHGRRPCHTTLSMQQRENTDLKAVGKWVACTAAMAKLLVHELLTRQYTHTHTHHFSLEFSFTPWLHAEAKCVESISRSTSHFALASHERWLPLGLAYIFG